MTDKKYIYFDNAASTKPYKEACDIAMKIAMEDYGNPGSLHEMGNSANLYLEKARRQILSILGDSNDRVNPFECIFTSGASESNNIAILGASYSKSSYSKRLITTTVEHDSVGKVFDKLEADGFEVIRLNVDKNGQIDWNFFIETLKRGVGLVSSLYCCNQNGLLLPIEKMAKLTKQYCPRAYFHTDVTQAVGKVIMKLENVDLVSFSGHKIGALRGSGVLLKRKNVVLIPPEVGGGQEMNLRPGTSNTPGDVSIAVALRIDNQTLADRTERVKKINDYIRDKLTDEDGIICMSEKESCIPFVLTYGLKHVRASVMDEFLSSHNIYVSTTSACDDRLKISNTALRGMGYESHCADNPIRLSFKGDETIEEVDEFVYWFKEGLKTLHPDD